MKTIALLAAALLMGHASAQAQSLRADSTLHHSPDNVITQNQVNREQVTTALDALSGRVAGLQIQRPNNGAAAMSAVRLRGTTSLTGGNNPLIIVDGVMGDLSMLSSVYPADIESFNIMKDASETAQYGSRGASGVIEVVTKRGSATDNHVAYNGSVGFTSVFKNLEMLSADGYRQQVSNRGLMLIDRGQSTNWQEAIERTGLRHDHHVAFSGGSQRNGYRVSLGLIDHDGVILHDNLRNFTSNMNMHQLMFNNRLKIEVGMFSNIEKDMTAVYDTQKTFYSAHTFNPTYQDNANADGSYSGFTLANQTNHPLALMDSRTQNKTTHISTHGRFTVDLAPGLNLVAFGSYSHNEVETSQFLPTSIWAHGQAYKGTRKAESLLGNLALNWDKQLAQAHHLSATALVEGQRERLTGFNVTTTNFTSNDLGFDAIQDGALTLWEGTSSYSERPTQTSVMGRVTYDYAGRYSLTVTARADGSSRFGDNNKWGFFPSVSGSWDIAAERFMAGTHAWLSGLKLRAGYGLSGNQGGIDNYRYTRLAVPSAVAPVGQNSFVSLEELRNANPELKWETKRTFNAGLDMSFLHGRIFATVDFYTAKTSDMLYDFDVPTPPFTFKTLLANVGAMRNSGAEFSLGFSPVVTRDWELSVNLNATLQRTKLLSLSGSWRDYSISGPDIKDLASLNGAGFHGGFNHIVYQIVGQPLGVFYLPHCTGLEQNEDGTQSYAIADLDGDGEINLANGADRQVSGQAIPKVLLGSNISLRYKNWDLSLQMNGAFGHKVYNGTALSYMNMGSLPGYNVLAAAPEMNISDQTATDYWLENGDYLNFDYVTLGWNVPLGEKMRKSVQSLRLALTVSNLATITGYNGLTPMVNSSAVNSTLGVDDKNIYPLNRTFSLSVSIAF